MKVPWALPYCSNTIPVISLLAGVAFSPHALNWIRPLQYANGDEQSLENITFFFSRLVLGVQLVIAGIQLPHRYLRTEWRSLCLLLGPGMTIMWLSASLLVWAMVPHLSFLHALAVGACVTPTDPVLSNSIVKGKFADKNIPPALQKIIIAESGANDGLGYPFLFLALYLIRYNGTGGEAEAAHGIGLWFGETWGYTIILSVIYGVAVGWVAKELLWICESRKYVDRESFIVFAITLALFITGTCGMIGSDDVLACFIAGNAFTWDDWFRKETEDDTLQPTIDMLLNISVFGWYGAVAPWPDFRTNDVIPIYRLIGLGILILLLRRLPMILLFRHGLREVESWTQALVMGFFGPIGVSAVFYLYVSLDFLNKIIVDGEVREDAQVLGEVIRIVVWFLAITSIVVHGLSVPFGKLGYVMPRTLSQALSSDNEGTDSTGPSRIHNSMGFLRSRRSKKSQERKAPPNPPTFMLGQRDIEKGRDNEDDEPSRPVRIIEDTPNISRTELPQAETEHVNRNLHVVQSASDQAPKGHEIASKDE